MRTLFEGKREYTVHGTIVVSRSRANTDELIASLSAIDKHSPWVDDEFGHGNVSSIANISGEEKDGKDGPYIVIKITPGTHWMRRGQLSAYTKYLNHLGQTLWCELSKKFGVVGLYAETNATKLAFLVS